MQAVNDYVIVDDEKVGPKQVGGLLLTNDTDEANRYKKATIISTGDLVERVKEGDVVYYDAMAGHGISYDKHLYRVIRMRDIVIVE